MDFFNILIYGVFELPLLRNATKREKRNKTKYTKFRTPKNTYPPHLVAICQALVAFSLCFLKRQPFPW
jgi:hypothetical protein